MKLRVLLALGFLAVASFVPLVALFFKRTSDEMTIELDRLHGSSIAMVTGASDMRLALQVSQAAVPELIAERLRMGLEVEPSHESEPLQLTASAEVIEESLDEFAERLRELRELSESEALTAAELGVRSEEEENGIEKWLDRLGTAEILHRERMERFVHLARWHPTEELGEYRADVLEPHYVEEMLPLIRAYEKHAEGDLAAKLQLMYDTQLEANRRNLALAAASLATALVLGFLIARRILRPVAELEEAARRVASGDLSERVEVESNDEIGLLGRSFNSMMDDLQATTVSRSYLDEIIQSMSSMLLVSDAEGRIRKVNRVAEEKLGRSQEELAGLPLDELLAPPPGAGELARPLHGEAVLPGPDGEPIPVECSESELRGRDGGLEGTVLLAQDISERKAADEKIRRSLEEKEILLREIHHRVKNNLQIVSSLLNLPESAGDSARLDRSIRESRDRIRSMALIHEQLYRSDDLARVDFAEYVERLLDSLVRSHGEIGKAVEFEVDVASEPLELDRAIPCGMIVNELVANALEHAFPEGAGRVRIAFANGRQGRLEVRDDGVGLPEGFAAGGTLGLRLVEALAGQLGGDLVLESDAGTRAVVTLRGESEEREVKRS